MQTALAETKQTLLDGQLSDFGNDSARPIVIVGAGPVGIRTAQELLRRIPKSKIIQYGAEPWMPYDRVKLSSLLAGEVNRPEIDNIIALDKDSNITQIHNCEIARIDREYREVIDIHGNRQPYSKLILAIGSTPHVPNIPGINNHNIFTFRSLSDTEQLVARRIRSRRTVVLGGGLLGIEAARAMQRNNTEVNIIEHNARLMQNQLDERGSEILREHLLSLGMKVYLRSAVKSIDSGHNSHVISLVGGNYIECDTVVVATGIRPNIQIALEAGLHIGRGVKVNDFMQTSDPDVYAVGECVEHNGNIYGLVAPGLEQASIAVHHIAGDSVSYRGSTASARLKVVGINVFSMGIVGDEIDYTLHKQIVYQDNSKGIYRSLTLKRFQVVGAVAIGDWPDVPRLQEMITNRRRVFPWQKSRFARTGLLWPESQSQDVTSWPARAIVCNCTGVTRGQITSAIQQGCNGIEDIAKVTGASGVCGSCVPLLLKLTNTNSLVEGLEHDVKGQRAITITSLIGLALILLLFTIPAIHAPQSVQHFSFNFLWENNTWKQVSGFSLLGMTAIGLLVSVRKRWRKLRIGHYNYWRVMHVVLGAFLLVTLAIHTGFHFGEQVNLVLMLTYIAIALSGTASALIVAFESKMSPLAAKQARSVVNYLHLVLFWPFPTLVGFHIVSFYYF